VRTHRTAQGSGYPHSSPRHSYPVPVGFPLLPHAKGQYIIEMTIELINKVDLEHLKNKTLFITGGTGFFGLWLLNLFRVLNNSGYNIEVTLLSRNPEKFIQRNQVFASLQWLHWLKGDVVSYAIPSGTFDMFIHGASDTKPEAMLIPSLVFQNIVLGTKHVLEHAIFCNAKRVLIISSGAVYGEVPSQSGSISEEVTTAPVTNNIHNVYGEAKRAAEMFAVCLAKESSIHLVIARCFAFAGSGIGRHLVLSQLINQALNDDELKINGSGMARRSFLHGQDLAIWLLKLLIDGSANKIYNVGSDKEYTIKRLAELVRDMVAPSKTIITLGEQKQEFRINYIPSINQAKRLGLNVWTTLEESIKEMTNPTFSQTST